MAFCSLECQNPKPMDISDLLIFAETNTLEMANQLKPFSSSKIWMPSEPLRAMYVPLLPFERYQH